jgi:hypothetical protein
MRELECRGVNASSTLSLSTDLNEHSLFFICLESYENIRGTLLQLQRF